MEKLQFRVLYRQFLFRVVDLDLLSAHALGDMNKLFGQFAALFVFISIGLAWEGLIVAGSKMSPELQVYISGAREHFLIATTMLVVGLFAILSWDSTFPSRRDVMMLAPLPVRARTIFFAKVAAVATALALSIAVLHIAAGLTWPFALNPDGPAQTVPVLAYDKPGPPMGVADLEHSIKFGALPPGAGIVSARGSRARKKS